MSVTDLPEADRGVPTAASSLPELSILLVTDSVVRLRKVLRCYRVQTDPARLEIVIAALAGADLSADPVRALGFVHVQVVRVAGTDVTRAEEQAVRAATAPFVVFAQAHAYPRPGFVDAVLAARRSGCWVGIGPAMMSANPDSVVSWAAMCSHYGHWSVGGPRGPVSRLPGHYCAYDRGALLSFGERLYGLLDAGAALQVALRARGGELFFEPAARVELVNVSRFGWYLVDQFFQSMKFATKRRRGWSLRRRLSYVVGAPVIPVVRLARILGDLRRSGRLHEACQGLPVLLAGLTVSAAGELVGYAVGSGAIMPSIDTARDRLRYLRPQDRLHEMDESTWPD
jgi:hypothetical protein